MFSILWHTVLLWWATEISLANLLLIRFIHIAGQGMFEHIIPLLGSVSIHIKFKQPVLIFEVLCKSALPYVSFPYFLLQSSDPLCSASYDYVGRPSVFSLVTLDWYACKMLCIPHLFFRFPLQSQFFQEALHYNHLLLYLVSLQFHSRREIVLNSTVHKMQWASLDWKVLKKILLLEMLKYKHPLENEKVQGSFLLGKLSVLDNGFFHLAHILCKKQSEFL